MTIAVAEQGHVCSILLLPCHHVLFVWLLVCVACSLCQLLDRPGLHAMQGLVTKAESFCGTATAAAAAVPGSWAR